MALTVGLEFEFLMETPDWPALEEESKEHAGFRRLADALKSHTILPIAKVCDHPSWIICLGCESLPDRYRVETQIAGFSSLFNVFSPHWMDAGLDKDPELRHDIDPLRYFHIIEEENFREQPLAEGLTGIPADWMSAEITSPVLTSRDVDAGLPQIKHLMEGFRKADIPMGINTDCGLHVHIGFGDGMTLIHAQKAISLAILLEMPLFDLLVSPERRAGYAGSGLSTHSLIYSEEEDSLANPSEHSDVFHAHIPSRDLFHANRWNSRNPDRLYSALVRTFACNTTTKLRALLLKPIGSRTGTALCLRTGHEDDTSDAYYEMQAGIVPSPSTVEFRYFQMTFDVTMVHEWVVVLSAVMRIAQQDDAIFKRSFHRLLTMIDYAEDHGFNDPWVDLLDELGLAGRIPFWRDLLAKYEAGVVFVGTDGGFLQRDTK
jgi:hypothetical protein